MEQHIPTFVTLRLHLAYKSKSMSYWHYCIEKVILTYRH